VPFVLLAAAVIAGGGTVLLGAATLHRLAMFKARAAGISELGQVVTHAAVTSAVTAQVLTGTGAIVLGIIALSVPAHAGILVLVGILALGASITVSGAALTGRLMRFFESNTI